MTAVPHPAWLVLVAFAGWIWTLVDAITSPTTRRTAAHDVDGVVVIVFTRLIRAIACFALGRPAPAERTAIHGGPATRVASQPPAEGLH